MKRIRILLIPLSLFVLTACLPQTPESLREELNENLVESNQSSSVEETSSSSSKGFLDEDLNYGNLGESPAGGGENNDIDEKLSSTQSSSEIQISSPTQEQKEIVIAWVYSAAEEYEKTLSYDGTEKWNVALNYIDNKNKWIVTTTDKNYNRVKAIFDWSGEDESDGILKYLLVQGETLHDSQ